MFNSCNYNTLVYNSTCVKQVVPPTPESGGRARIKVRRKVLYKQFFDIVGQKLMFNIQYFNLIAFILFAEK